MKPRNFYRTIIGVSLILSSIFLILLTDGEVVIGTMLLASGLAFLITRIYCHRKFGDDQESDERSKKIGAYGLSYSWLTGLFFMADLFWLDNLDMLRITAQNALAESILVLALSRSYVPDVYLPESRCCLMGDWARTAREFVRTDPIPETGFRR